MVMILKYRSMRIVVTIYRIINYSQTNNVTADIYTDLLTLQNVNDNIADMIICDKRTSTKDDVKPTVMNGQRTENESINDNNEWQPCLQRQIGGDMKPARRYPAIPWDLSRSYPAKPSERKVDIADNGSSRRFQSFSYDFFIQKEEENLPKSKRIPQRRCAKVIDSFVINGTARL